MSEHTTTLLYKLTNQDGQTKGGLQWGPGVTHTASGEGELCGSGWLHAYLSPELAVLMNPIHAEFSDPRLWEAQGVIGRRELALKVGCTTLTTVRELPLPSCSIEQRVLFAVRCALSVSSSHDFRAWAEGWLSGSDRSEGSAGAAVRQAEASKMWAAAAAAAAAEWAMSATERSVKARAVAPRAAAAGVWSSVAAARAAAAGAAAAEAFDLVALARGAVTSP